MPGVKSAGKLFKSRDDFQQFHVAPYQTALYLIAIYGVILSALAIVWFLLRTDLSPLLKIGCYFVVFFVIGWGQFSISNALHEALHRNLFNKTSDILASIFTAYPVGLTMAYRDVHQAHHKYLGTEKDPDYPEYIKFPRSKLTMIIRFFWYLCGLPAVIQFLKLRLQKSETEEKKTSYELLGLISVQFIIMLSFLFVFESIFFYIVFWLLPVVTVGKLCSSTRLMCEHSSPDRDWVLRSIHGPRWKTWVLGAFDFNYHAEHHLAQTIPFPKLKDLYVRHKEVTSIAQKEDLDFRIETFEGGYLGLLWHWFKELPWINSKVDYLFESHLQTEKTSCCICGNTLSKEIASGRDYLHATTDQSYSYVQCNSCAHIYLNPRPTIEEISKIYPPSYSTFDPESASRSSVFLRVKDHVLRKRFKLVLQEMPKNGEILDIGCGDISLLKSIRNLSPRAGLTGLDWHFGPRLEESANAMNIQTITGTIENADLPENHYDVILMNQLIEHVWDVDAVLSICKRALKPGGILSIETPNADGWDRKFFNKGSWGGYYWPRHLNIFSAQGLRSALSKAGFEEISHHYLLAPPIWIYSLQFGLSRRGYGNLAKRVVSDKSIFWLSFFTFVDLTARLFRLKTSNQKIIVRKVANVKS